jgi:hypothetical protein
MAAGDVMLNCGVSTFDSTTLTFGNWCGQNLPAPVVRTQAGGPEIVVLAARHFTIAAGATLRLTGSRPVVLAVFGNATVAGTVDANASGATPGAGGNATCTATRKGGEGTGSASGGASGGGGGGFGTAGAAGGDGGQGVPGVAGVAGGTVPLVPLVGGCPGGLGGGCATNLGGAGGGSIQFSVAGTLSISGTVRANGGIGVAGCASEGGGGGGGSGGGILLEGSTVTSSASAVVQANGGKGGDGASGGVGGRGGTGTLTPLKGDNSSTDGGGGGGGSVGRIRIHGIAACTTGGAISPAASLACP